MFLIVENDPEVPPGLLEEVLREEGIAYMVARPCLGDGLPPASNVTALVVLGGRMGARDEAGHPYLKEVRELMRDAALAGRPVLGICLGGQMLADALGGTLKPKCQGEKGVKNLSLTPLGTTDPLFYDVPYRFVTFHWHEDSFELPEGAVLLASGETCRNQAFRFDSRAYGVQFHPEIDGQIVKGWAKEEEPVRFLREYEAVAVSHRDVGVSIFRNFLKIAGHTVREH